MLDIPAEMYDQIASQFEFCCPSTFDTWNYNAPSYQGYEFLLAYPNLYYGTPDIKSLQNLRLTSRSFHRAATRVLSKSTLIHWRVASKERTQIQSKHPKKDSELCLNRFVKYIELDFKDRIGWELQPPSTSEDKEPESASFPVRIAEVFGHATKLPNLQSLKADVPRWKSEYNPEPSNGHVQLNLDILQAFTQQLSQILTQPEQWKYLKDLRLALPSSHDYLQLSRTIPDELLARLDRLSLTVTDATGPDGAKQYLEYVDEDGSGQEVFPPSNIQVLYPNSVHSHGVFDIVSRCPNLKSLGIEGTHHLDTNVLKREKKAGLENLYLKRVRISAENLIILSLGDGPNRALSLSTLWFEDIELTAGTWTEVFSDLGICPELLYLNPVDLGYARNGESAGHRPWSPWGGHHHEDVANLWSTNEEDEETLMALMENLAQRAGGRGSYANFFEEQKML
ncbi:uncharacterized protein PAC_19445 [Phialocephala subalpina]|uniref:Uncharacterized protein n=1 Tax=Phialocephala subalpina TaxID=576137 RepID=A0A1L7XX90_9HELO|nr:uncharacterized protein PAC_19445 [Phialocephala subalpina]